MGGRPGARSLHRSRLVLIGAVIASSLVVGAPGPTSSAAVYPGCTIDRSYRQGDRGDGVHCIEQALRAQTFQWGYVDTVYGSTTVTAVRNFQWAKRLLPLTGVVDERVATALGIWHTPSPPTTTTPPTTAPPTTTTPPTTTPTTTPPTTTPTTAPPATAPPATAPPTTPPTTTAPAPACTVTQQLSLAMRGSEVACLERRLRELGLQSQYIDDYFGTYTRDRGVKSAERLFGLPADGVADQVLLERLGIWATPLPPAVVPVPPGGWPLMGKVTVISDSAMAGIRWNGALGGLRGAVFDTQLQSCRRLVEPSCRGREGITPKTTFHEIESLSVPGAHDLLVVATGYNDRESRFSSDFDLVIAAARSKGFTRIAWVTYRSRVSYQLPRASTQRFSNYAQMNATLRAKVALGVFPEVVVWDLDAYTTTGASKWFTSDGVHETKLGSWGVADWVSRHVAAMAGKPCPMPWSVGAAPESPCPNPDPLPAVRGLPNIAVLYRL